MLSENSVKMLKQENYEKKNNPIHEKYSCLGNLGGQRTNNSEQIRSNWICIKASSKQKKVKKIFFNKLRANIK